MSKQQKKTKYMLHGKNIEKILQMHTYIHTDTLNG